SSTRCTTATMLRENRPLTTMVISTKASRMRRANGCLACMLLLREAIAHAMHRLHKRASERLVEHLAQLMNMAAQAVAVRAVIAPQGFFQYLTANHRRAFLHQNRQQFERQRFEPEQLAGASDLQGIEVVAQVADL